MKHRDIFEWDDDAVCDRNEFIDYFILDELQYAVDNLDLSEKTIKHLHNLIDKVRVHLNRYLKDGEVVKE